MKKSSIAFLTIILVGISLWIPSNNNIVSSQTIVKISGYVLDPNGNGVAGATITFHLLPIFRSASTNSSGYYEVTTYSGKNDVSITPPSNSNYVQFYQQSFNVQSNMTANFILSSGYRLSGYVLDQNLNPVSSWYTGGVGIFLDTYWSGKWADSNGYFYVVAPPGNHTIYARQMEQVVYSGISYFGDYEVLNNTVLNLNGNVIGNIIINFPNSTPSPTPTPYATPSTHPTINPFATPPNFGPTSPPTPTPTGTPPPSQITTATSSPTPTPTPAITTTSPSASPSSTPSVPELSFWTIPLLLTMMMALAGLLVYHKKQKQGKLLKNQT